MGKGQELLDAAREGDRKTVEKILGQITKRSGPFTSLRRGAGVNVQDDNGYTPLHHACLRGHKEIVRLLLSVDASPCIVDKKGATALHLAAWKGDSDVVAMLLGHNNPPVNIDQLTSDQETALLIAAQFGNVNVVAQLLARGADVTIRNVKDESALDLAAQYGRLETVMHLLRARPQLVDPYRFPVCRGHLFSSTPLHRASKNGHKDVVATLISAGIDPNVRTYSGTALHEAANYGKASVVRILLAKGADLNAADRRGKTVNDLLNEYSEEATKRVRRIIQEHIASNYDSEEDLPPFPVQDYSPTGYPNAPGMKAPETPKNSSNTNKGLSSSSSFLTKSQPQNFVKKLANWANMGIRSKFNSAPNISNNTTSETDITVATKACKKTGTLQIGNSKFFNPVKFLSKKSEECGEMICTDEFDTISLDRLATLDRDAPVNRSNRSCPGFKNSLPNISENNELSGSENSITDMVIVEADSENNNKTDKKIKPTEAINLRPKLSIFEPRETNSIERTRISTVSHESVINVNYESCEFDKKKEIVIENVEIKPKPPPRPTVDRKTSNEGAIYENITFTNAVLTPKPAARKHIAPKIEEKKLFYENVIPHLEIRQKPEPPKRTMLPIKTVVSAETIESSPSQSRTSTLSSGSMTDEANFEDILLSKKSRSFKHRTNFSAHSTVEKSRSRKSSQSSDDSDATEASALDNVDVSHELNEKSMYLSMTGTLPSKKPVKEVKKKVLFRHKTFTNIEIDGKSSDKEFKRNNEFIKDTLVNYHIRGTGHCIYKAPTVKEFIYIFNRDTLYSDVAPFEKVPNKRDSYFETAICFCKPRPPKFHKSAEDLLSISKDEEVNTIDLEALRKSTEMQVTSFQCFCDSDTCKYHVKNRESPNNLVVKFSAIKKSISTPDITLNLSPNLTTNKTGLTKNKSVPILEEPYAVVDIVSKHKSDKCNNDVEDSNACNTMSPPSTFSTSSRPYSIKDITDVISLKTSPSNASDVAQNYLRQSSTSEHSGHWSLHTCDSNVTIKSDMSFKSCLEEIDSSDDETLSEGDISDTDTVKSERRKPWVHSESFKFTSTDPVITSIPEESIESGIETSEELSPNGVNIHEGDSNSEESSFDYEKVNVDVTSDSNKLNCANANTKTVDSDSGSTSNDSESNVPLVMAKSLASLERGVWGADVCSGSGRRRWDEAEGTSEGDALSVSSAASSCAPHHLAHHLELSKVSPTPPKKPPRRNLSVSPTHANSPSSVYSYELRSHARSQDDLDEIQGAKQYLKHGRSVDHCVDGKLSYSEYEENHNSPRVAPIPNPRPSLKNRSQPVAITVKYENFPVKALNPRRKLKRNPQYENYEPKMTEMNASVVRSRKYSAQERSSLESLLDDSQSMNSPSDYERNCEDGRGVVPLSPTHYEQPPTPDHPPPSAKQAENSIHERIRPLSQRIMEVIEEIRLRKKSQGDLSETS